jgi:hypothetical protein
MTNHKKRLSFPLEPARCLELDQSRGLENEGKGNRQEEKNKEQSSVNWFLILLLLLSGLASFQGQESWCMLHYCSSVS